MDWLPSSAHRRDGLGPEEKAEGFSRERLLVLPKTLSDVINHALVSPLFISDIGHFPQASGHFRERLQGSDGHIAILCADGEGWVETADTPRRRVSRGSMLLLRRGTPHAYGANTDSPWSIYWFHFAGHHADIMVPYLLRGAGQCTVLPLMSEVIEQAVVLFDEAYAVLERGFTVHHMAFSAQIVSHLLGLTSFRNPISFGVKQPHSDRLNRALDLMQSRLSSTLTLWELADHIGLSRSRFHEVFKEATGTAPIDYYLRLKMQRACQYLDLTEQDIRTVAEAVGIEDPYYFSRLFHKLIGVSPSTYRLHQKG